MPFLSLRLNFALLIPAKYAVLPLFSGLLMDIKQIMEIIPHRQPFLLIDAIEELEPGVRAVAKKLDLVELILRFFA